MASVPGEVSGRAVVVASTVSTDAHVELLQLQDAAREAGPTKSSLSCRTWDTLARTRRSGAASRSPSRAVARALSTGTDRVLTVNPHEEAICEFFDVPAEPVDAAGRLADPLPDDLTDPLFLSPDEGAVDIAAAVRDAYGAGETDYFEKDRDYDTGGVEITPSDADVGNRDVVLADDIIATGSTMSEAVAVLNDRGAGRVFVSCVHPMLASNALTKLESAGVERVYGTDTIERAVSAVSAAPAVADEL